MQAGRPHRLWRLWSFRDRYLFDAALDVARDGSATTPSRVYSFMMLVAQLSDLRYPRYGNFIAVGEYDVCRLSTVHGRGVESGTPLPADARSRAWALARAMQVAPSNPAEVRSAARCLDQVLYRDSVVEAGPPLAQLANEP